MMSRMMSAMPPRWAEAILRLLLAPRDRETVSGDLLEEYREVVHPARGRRRADLWYVTQVVGFAWRTNRLWAVLFSAAFVARTALDWLVPTADFRARATTSTAIAIGILLCAGFWAAWRSGSLRAGALAGVATTLIAAVISIISASGAAALLAIWHDPQTLSAVQGSGGLEEVFTLPVTMVAPGACLGALGGMFGSAARKIARH